MKLNVVELDDIPKTLSKIEFIGETKSETPLAELIQSAYNYVNNHPNYHVLLNNCRTFVEYLIDQIPDFKNTIPRKNGSILEYYHAKAKHEHPGAIIKSKTFLKAIRDLHRFNLTYKYTNQLVVRLQSPLLHINHTNTMQAIEQ